MDYNAPTGSTDLNAPYIGKNVSAGIQGSKVPPKAVEFPQREIVNAILGAGLTPSNGDQTQLWQAIQKACQGQGIMIGTAGGTANAITTTLDPVPGSPASWSKIRLFLLKITATNTDLATVAPNGLPARSFKRNDGSTPLSAGDLAQGGVALCLNDGANVQLLAMLPQMIAPVVGDTLHGIINARLLPSGTYYPTTGTKRGLVFVTGGGGAGGNAVGGGGGSGSTAIALFDATTIGAGGIQCVVGAYGVPNPNTGSIIWGGNGGTSSFGSIAVAGGGFGGSSSDSSTTNGIGGSGGIATAGTFYIGGNAGMNGTGSNGQPGDGGGGAGSFWGGGAAGGHNTSTSGGVDGYAGVLGGGGGGADGPNPNKGGGGGYGVIFVLEFA